MDPIKESVEVTFPFTSTDSITNTIVAETSEPTLRIELSFNEALDLHRLNSAIECLVNDEPILSCKLELNPKPRWIKQNPQKQDYLHVFDDAAAYRAFKANPVDIYSGPLIQCALLKGEKTKLLIKLAHEISDGFGAKQAAAYIAKNYRRDSGNLAYSGESYSLSRSSKKLLTFIPFIQLFRLFVIYLRDKKDMFGGGKTVNVSHEIYPSTNPDYFIYRLDKKITSRLREYARSKSVTINDLVLTAFLRSIAKGSNDPDELFRISMTVNLRRYAKDMEAMPISNLSSIECINLNRDLGESFEDSLLKVNSIIKRKKANWIGLSMIFDLVLQKLLSFKTQRKVHKNLVKDAIEKKNTAFLLTNVGRVNASDIAFDQEPCELEMLGPVVKAPFWNTVVYEFDNEIYLTSYVYAADERISTLQKLYESVSSEISSVVSLSDSE